MASKRWLTNAAKAAIAGAAVTAVAQVATAAIAKWPCPAPAPVSQCAALQNYVASMNGKPLSAAVQKKFEQCTGARP